jgi:hypothetical protein
MTPWANLSLSAVTSTGNLTQLYPASCTAGTGANTMGNEKRGPCEGILVNAQVETDGIDGGLIELWDVNGADAGADVDTATVITNAQLAAMVAAGKARIMYAQNFSGGSGSRLAIAHGVTFAHGLAGRFVAAAGSCSLNLIVSGGCRKTQITG